MATLTVEGVKQVIILIGEEAEREGEEEGKGLLRHGDGSVSSTPKRRLVGAASALDRSERAWCWTPPQLIAWRSSDRVKREEAFEAEVEAGKQRLLQAKQVLWRDLSFSVPAGARLIIVGPSGVGKSLLLRALAGLDPLSEGRVVLSTERGEGEASGGGVGPVSHTWRSLGMPQWRTRVSYVSQAAPTIPGTPDEYLERCRAFKAQAGRPFRDPAEFASRWNLPATAFSSDWGSLSGGERQRAALIIALALCPDVLLLDEPTSSLDPVSTLCVEESLVRSGITSVIVTHSVEQAKRLGTLFLSITEDGHFLSNSLPVVISYALSLGLESAFILGGFRTTVQLSLLGYVLLPVFEHSSWWATTLLVLGMATMAAREAYTRSKYYFQGMFACLWIAVALPPALLLGLCLFGIIPVRPWYQPSYAIPLMGMLLNNCLNSVSVGFSLFINELGDGRHVVDDWLARGATMWEATQPLVIKSVRTGLMPTLNNMLIIGLVSIPGMMTGQILGGNSPEQAARYQMIIMYLICATSTLGLLLSLWLCCLSVFDHETRLLSSSKLRARKGGKMRDDILSWRKVIVDSFTKAWVWTEGKLRNNPSGGYDSIN